MFRSARIKLTTRYLLIIMVVSLLFSFVIYGGINAELTRIESFQKARAAQTGCVSQSFPVIHQTTCGGEIPQILIFATDQVSPNVVEHARTRIVLILVMINMAILAFSGVAGYVLAGQTLQPIQEMVDDQHRFITDASHELRTPLTALRSEIEVNLRDKKMSLATSKELLHSNLEEVKKLQQLSDRLIQLSQPTELSALQLHEVSLATVIDEAVKRVQPLAKAQQITIQQQLPDLKLMANATQLTEVFVILLDNAIKYGSKKSTVTVSAVKQQQHIQISVTDLGKGIAQKDLPHIFDRFYRADASRTESAITGYGLGLSIARKIIERHHGSITAHSTLNQGTTFTLLLPIAAGSSSHQ